MVHDIDTIDECVRNSDELSSCKVERLMSYMHDILYMILAVNYDNRSMLTNYCAILLPSIGLYSGTSL